MSDVKYYTQEGLDALKAELNQLESVERAKISAMIAEARDKGDLSENAEYDAAKDAQGLLELRINKLRALVANARVLDDSKIDTSKILIYSTVEIKNLKNNMTMKYTIVPESDADLRAGKISVTSPIAKGLIGKGEGDKVAIQAPAGIMEFEITKVTR